MKQKDGSSADERNSICLRWILSDDKILGIFSNSCDSIIARSHSQGEELLEHVKDVRVQILGEEECLQSRAVLFHLLVMLKANKNDQEKSHRDLG